MLIFHFSKVELERNARIGGELISRKSIDPANKAPGMYFER